MQIRINVPEGLNDKINDLTKKLRLKKSEIIRLALEQFLKDHYDNENQPYEKVKNLIGIAESGIIDLGTNHRKYLNMKIKK